MGLQHFCQHLPVKSWIVRDGEELGILHADLRIASAVHEAGSRAGSRAEACLLGPGFRLSTAVLQHADPAWGREGPWWAGSFCRSPPSSLSRLMSLHKMRDGELCPAVGCPPPWGEEEQLRWGMSKLQKGSDGSLPASRTLKDRS